MMTAYYQHKSSRGRRETEEAPFSEKNFFLSDAAAAIVVATFTGGVVWVAWPSLLWRRQSMLEGDVNVKIRAKGCRENEFENILFISSSARGATRCRILLATESTFS